MSKGWKASLAEIIAKNCRAKQIGTKASLATQRKRQAVLYLGFAELRQLGYRLDSVRSFRSTHMSVLAQHWEEQGIAPATLQNRISIFRIFCGWIAKPGMIETSSKYVKSEESVRRTTINKQDKSWTAKGVDIAAKLEEVRRIDDRVALILELAWHFGLRVNEAGMMRPHHDDKKLWLEVERGAKNGRLRNLPIDSEAKREVLERAKLRVGLNESLFDPARGLEEARAHFYRVMRKAGITRAHGITPHGLRHELANDVFERLAETPSPVRGGQPPADPEKLRFARLEVAELLGHSREDVVSHYVGSYREQARNR